MGKVEITSVSDEEIAILKKGIFREKYSEDFNSLRESAEIFKKLSVSEVASLINEDNYLFAGLCSTHIFKDDGTCENKMMQAISLYEQMKIEEFIRHYNDGSVVEYVADKRLLELAHLCRSIEFIDEENSGQLFDKNAAKKYLTLLNGIFCFCADDDIGMRVNYDGLREFATSLGYYSSVSEEDVCDYLVSEDAARSRFCDIILKGGEGFTDLAKDVSLSDRVLMTVDFAVNYNEQNEKVFAKYDTSSFVNDFLNDQVINSTILGMPVHRVIRYFAPGIRDKFLVNHNSDYNVYTFCGDFSDNTEQLEKLSSMFSQDIDSKRDVLTDSVTAGTKQLIDFYYVYVIEVFFDFSLVLWYNMSTNWGVGWMRILVGDELLEFSEDELDARYINEGCESIVYQYGNEVLKIYKRYCGKDRLTEKDASVLTEIETKRILLPRRIIKEADTGIFMGYSLPLIQVCSKKVIPNMPVETFVDELDLLHDDIRKLSDNRVDIEDLYIDNVLYDGRFFLGDPGSFVVRRNSYQGDIYRDNICTLNRFVIDDVFGMVKITKAGRNIIDCSFDCSHYIGDEIRDTARPKEKISQYVKRIVK